MNEPDRRNGVGVVLRGGTAGGGGSGASEAGPTAASLSDWRLFALQTSAVLRKNATLQRRAWAQNLCLVGLPLLFCVLLLVLQRLVNTQLGSSDDYRCGCKCLECCDWVVEALDRQGDGSSDAASYSWECYKATDERPCSPYAHCKARDRNQCGAQYSTYAQIAFCDVRYPSTWPAVLQVPLEEYRPTGQEGPAAGGRVGVAGTATPSSTPRPPPIVAPYTGVDVIASRNLSLRVVPVGGDRGVGARILRDLQEVQRRLRPGSAGGDSGGGADRVVNNSTGSAVAGGGSSNSSSNNPLLEVLSGTLGRSGSGPAAAASGRGLGLAAAAAGRSSGDGGGNGSDDGDDDGTAYVDLCDPSVDVAALFRGSAFSPPVNASAAAVNGSKAVNGSAVDNAPAPATSVAAGLTPEQLAEAASALTQILSDYDLLLGTATDAPYTNLLEPALIVGSRVLGASSGAGSSSVVRGGSGGGSGGHLLGGGGGGGGGGNPAFITDPDQVIPLYHMSRNCSALTATDRLVLSQLSCALRRGLGLPELRCATWAPDRRPDVSAIERELFCGWAGAGCTAPHSSDEAAAAPAVSPPRSQSTSPSTPQGAGRRMLQQQERNSPSQRPQPPADNLNQVPATAAAAAPGAAGSTAAGTETLSQGGTVGLVSAAPAQPVTTSAAPKTSPGTTTVAPTNAAAEVERIVQYPSAVYDWRESGPAGLDLRIWVNNSDVGASVAPRVQRWPAAINAATNAWLSATAPSRGQRQPWTVRLAGVKGFPTRGSPLSLDLASLMGPLFFMWVMQLLLPTYVHALVKERETGAQLLMRQQGLRPAPAALAAYCWFAVLYGVFMLVFVGFGAAIGLNIFTKTGPAVQAVFYLVWGHAMVAWAFWFAAVWGSAAAATLAATTTVVLTGLVANMIVAQFVTSGPYWLATLMEAFPSFALFRGLWEMSQYAFLAAANGSRRGLTWSRLYDDGNGMTVAWALLAAVTVWCVLWTWYWGKVFGPDDQGVHSHPFFFLGYKLGPDDPRGWDWFTAAAFRQRWTRLATRRQRKEALGRDGRDRKQPSAPAATAAAGAAVLGLAADEGDPEPATESVEGEDVLRERRRVEVLWRRLTSDGDGGGGGSAAAGLFQVPVAGASDTAAELPPALLLRNVRKVFPGQGSSSSGLGGGGGGGGPHVAVRDLSLAVGSRETLGLLGPNGAGKTTTLRIMQGILEPSSGSVLVCGLDLASRTADVARLVGICPQHDVLWPLLTGREHVRLFGRIKGLRGSALEAAVSDGLAEAGLADVADVAAGSYSGGMQRRLSVVCALVGSPRVLYLDEPSTGLDPASRRLLWKAVLGAKRRCAIVLTTHSMEEAEALCDRLGLAVGGALRCLGSPQELMARYSSYLLLSLTVAPGCSDEEAEAFVRACVSPAAKQVYCLNGFHSYEVPRTDVDLAALFRKMAAAQAYGERAAAAATATPRLEPRGGRAGIDNGFRRLHHHAAASPSNRRGDYADWQRPQQEQQTLREHAAPVDPQPDPHCGNEPLSAAATAAATAVAAAAAAAAPGVDPHWGLPRDAGRGGGPPVALRDWAVSSATLESVFVRICREAGAVVEAAGGS